VHNFELYDQRVIGIGDGDQIQEGDVSQREMDQVAEMAHEIGSNGSTMPAFT